MTERTSPTSAGRTFVPADNIRVLYIGIAAIWVIMPFLLMQNVAQDAVPFVVAGELSRTDPSSIYATNAKSLYDLPPAFSERSCAISPPGTDCSQVNVAFVSPPPAIPLATAFAAVGPAAGILLFRIGAGACVAAGMILIWHRLAHRTRHAPALLLASALLLVPLTMAPVVLGQTSPLLFLSCVLGPGDRRESGSGAAGRAAVWVGAVATKLFPLAMGVVLVAQRRWRFLAWAAILAAGLSVLALAVVPVSAWTDFITSSNLISGYSLGNAYNGSLASVLHAWAPTLADTAPGTVLVLGAQLLVIAGLGWWGMRRADATAKWAYAWVALLFLLPLVWAHYLLVCFGALAAVLGSLRRLDDSLVVVLPVAAALLLLATLPPDVASALPVVRLLLLTGTLVAVPLLAREHSGSGRAPAPAGI